MARSSDRKFSRTPGQTGAPRQLRRGLRARATPRAWCVRPLVLALMGALPWAGHAAPALHQLPTWRNGAWINGNATVSISGPAQQNMLINQVDKRAIYNWASFSIGRDASVTFDMAQPGSQALNRVVGVVNPATGKAEIAPSEIFGKLSATNGGEIFLINSQGILFGQGAQVNVGGLFASTLDVLDQDFLSGLASISQAAATFSWRYAGGTKLGDSEALPLYNGDAFVMVDAGARITTPSGGRVFLLSPKTTNQGRIDTPQGQTVLASGGEVYLNSPLNGDTVLEPIYASENNPNIPALRGLLVEVSDGPTGGPGQTTNAGTGTTTLQASASQAAEQIENGIFTAGGNTTLVGYAVNQAGRISASTSASRNGSVFLLARSGTQATNLGDHALKHATTGGVLTVAGTSRIEMLADNEVGANGAATTSTDAAGFTASRIEMSGHSIDLQSGSQIKAPGAQLRARAEDVPNYSTADGGPPGTAVNPATLSDAADPARAASARVTVASGAVIDVSGTTTAVVDGARNFVTTGVLGKNDLADAPAAKNNPVIYYQPVSFDIRSDVPIMSTDGNYAKAVQRTAEERMAVGGTVDLTSSGVVATSAGATVDVSGGQINYTATNAKLSKLTDSAGKTYLLNDAPANLNYTKLVTVLRPEQAYAEGKAAGKFTVTAGTPLLAGTVRATTVVGQRQRLKLDPAAQRALLSVTALSSALSVAPMATGLDGTEWAKLQGSHDAVTLDALTLDHVPGTAALSGDLLGAGFGTLNLVSDQGISLAAHTDLNLAPEAQLTLLSRGAQGIDLASSIHSAGGSVTLQAEAPGALSTNPGSDGNYHVDPSALSGVPTAGITLHDGVALDVAGQLVNLYRDGAAAQKIGTHGGTVKLNSQGDLLLGAGTAIDVSGGAVVSVDGKSISAGDAGSIALAVASDHPGHLVFGTGGSQPVLQGYALGQGGTLSISAHGVHVGATPDAQSDVNIGGDFFSQGGFKSFDLNGQTQLTVADNTVIAPRQTTWQLPLYKARNAASGTRLAALADRVVLPDGVRHAVNLTLSAPTYLSETQFGQLVVGHGAVIDSDPLATVNLLAEGRLEFDGRIRDAGGTVNLTLQEGGARVVAASADAAAANEGLLWLGQGSVVDVSGLAQAFPQTDARLRGQVLAGGAINLAAPSNGNGLGGFVWVADGARLDARGAQGSFDTLVGTASGTTQTRRVTTYSDGGSVSVAAPQGALLEGQMLAQAGGPQAAGGRLSVSVSGAAPDNTTSGVSTPGTYRIALQSAAGHDSAAIGSSDRAQIDAVKAARFGAAVLSTNLLAQGGFADVALQAADRIDVPPTAAGSTSQSVTLGASRSVALSAPAYQVADGSTLVVNAPSVSFGNTSADSPVHGGSVKGQTPRAASAGSGTIELNGSGQVVLNGVTALQGVQDFKVSSAGDVVLTASKATPGTAADDKRPAGQLDTLGNVTIKAAQVYTATDEKFSINTPTDTGVVTFAGNGATPAKPLSAGSTLTVNAHRIVQGGVVRAPLGQINFNADRIQLLAGSETSVSGAGLLVPFGSTVNGSTWTYNGLSQTDPTVNDARTALLEKQVTLNAPTGQVDVQAGARVDATAGGDVVAYEFVPGPGGSTDAFAGAAGGAFAIVPGLAANATGYAPIDRAILSQTDASGGAASITVGQQITFGAGGPVPAGTYTVLPARYALLPGGFLVKADGGAGRSGAVDLNAPAVKLADGASSVAGVVSYAGTSISDTLAHRFVVAPNSVSSQYSEIKSTTGNAYFAALDSKAQRTPRPLPQDAGTVSINTLQLALAANTLRFTTDGSPDGTLELAAQNIHVGDDLAAEANTLTLSAATLNSSGAGTVLLGATREPASNDQRTLDVKADSIVVDGSTTALQGSDIALVANHSIELKDGAKITATTRATTNKKPADTYAVSGDGASLRVSGDATANVVRTGSTGTQGTLALGAVQLDAGSGSVVAEASQRNTIAEGAQFKTQALTIGGNIALGAVPAGADQLAITPALSQQINAAQRITLRSYQGLNVYAGANAAPVLLGGAGVKQLTLDTAAITAMSPAAATQLRIEAGQLALTNTTTNTTTDTTTSVAPTAQGGHGVLDLVANGSNGQSGDVIVGPGTVVTQGFGTTNVNAARSVVVAGTGGLSVGGDLNLTAASVTAQSGAVSRIESGGNVTIRSNADSNGAANGAAQRATAGLGATLSVIAAQHIEQAGRIELPSGVLNLQARGGDTVDAQGQRVAAIEFADGSSTSVAGQTLTLSGNTVNTFGGTLRAQADAGSIHQAQGATLDVSAPATGADAGELSLSATQGAVDLQGRVVGTAGAGQQSGSIDIDAQQAVDLHQLSTALAAEGGRNFTQHIAVRNRAGSQTLQAGDTLKAQDIALVSDGNAAGEGRLDIQGTLNADGASGGSITLAARRDLTVQQGALLSAQATVAGAAPAQHAGGTIALSSSEGSVALNGGTLNVGPAEGTAGDAGAAAVADHGGVVTLRAVRVGGTDVKVAAIRSNIQGARSVQVEATQVYQAANGVVDTTVADADNATLRNNAAAIKQRLTNDPALSGVLQVRPGVEVQSSGDLTLSQAWNLGSGATNGDPVNLTLRAAGNLNIAANLSAGFNGTAATSLAQTGPASDIRLVAGADLASANPLATQGAAGDVVIGQPGSSGTTFVRSTTGNIAVAAAHDVQLASNNAAIYTTGQPVAPGASYTALGTTSRTAPQATYASVNMAVNNFYKALTGATTPFYAQGGSVSLTAGHDVAGTAAANDQATNPNAWWYVNDLVEAQQTSWWTRYDLFKQGIGALAGGNVNVQAGHNVSDLQLAAMSNGYQVGSAPALTYGGGSVAVTAGQDIVASNALATGEAVRYQAGGSILGASDANSATPRASGPIIGLFNGRASIQATRDVQLSEVGNAMRLAQFVYRAPAGISDVDKPALASQISKSTTRMFSQTAQVQIGSAGGDAGTVNSGFADSSYFRDFNSGGKYVSVSDNLAASFAISAPSGSINVGNLVQYLPTTGPSGIALLAGQNLTVDSIAQHGALAGGANDAASPGKLGLDATTTKPRASVALVAESGDLTINSESYLAAPTQFAAGRDINLGAQATNGVSVQHQAANELTSIVAGRDVNLGVASDTNGGVKVSGPGDLLVVAGRDVNLGASPGIVALGDNLNSALPSGSAQVSVLAGVKLKAGDFTQAAQAGYAVLGWQRLSAADLGAIENTVTQAYLQSQGKSSVSQLDTAQSNALHSQVRAQQLSAALDRADALGLHFADQLVSFMRQQQPGAQSTSSTGSASTHDTQLAALLAFDQLSPERQALFMQKVLVAELRAAGRSAVGTSGAARDAAYAPAYASIEALFPGATAQLRAAGDISMATSQIETVQGSGINLLTPGGGINAGQTASGANAKRPDELGIVTLAGGDINGVVNNNFLVNSSRVFTVGLGDMLLWSSQGNIDAGRGAKTVVGTPPPRYYVDSSGKLQVDTAASFSGSGIAVLNADSSLDLYAPRGEINAGDAGIAVKGKGFIDARVVIGATNISGPSIAGVPTSAPVSFTPIAAPIDPNATSAGNSATALASSDTGTKTRSIDLDFLGMGDDSGLTAQPPAAGAKPAAPASRCAAPANAAAGTSAPCSEADQTSDQPKH